MAYVREVLSLPAVKEARWSAAEGGAELCVLVEGEDPDDAITVHALRRAYRARYGYFPAEVVVVSTEHVTVDNLAPADWVFQGR
jgi:hypothetical protein